MVGVRIPPDPLIEDIFIYVGKDKTIFQRGPFRADQSHLDHPGGIDLFHAHRDIGFHSVGSVHRGSGCSAIQLGCNADGLGPKKAISFISPQGDWIRG